MSLRKISYSLLCFSLLLAGIPSIALSQADSPSISLEDGTTHAVDLVDQEREDGKLAIFTRNYGNATKPFSTGTAELIITNDTVAAKNIGGTNGTYIPSNGYVLSGTGSAMSIVNGLQVGDAVTTNIPIRIFPEKYFIINNEVIPITQVNAGRGEADVVLYLPSYGSSTKTNPWGMEITVIDGKVSNVVTITQDASGNWLDNNSPIPAGGYVLSIQSGNPFFNLLNGTVHTGDAVELNTSNEVLFKATKTSYNALNPKTREENPGGWDDLSNAPFPGFRGADQLIVYDSSYGVSTGTNPWGYEVVINQDGKVIRTGGNDSVIPQGGYVVSGHGVKASWLREQAAVGATFRLLPDKKEVLFLFTPESYLEQARSGIEAAENALLSSKQQFLDVAYSDIEQQINLSKASFESLKSKIERGDYNRFLESFNALNEEVSKAGFMNYESRKVDHRSVWIRPKETNIDQVKQTIAKLQALNMNSIYLETWWNGFTIFPTENELAAQNPIYGGFDVLQAYIDEGKKAGIEIHAWVENFFVGVSGQIGPVKSLKPEWSMISRQGHDYQYVPMYNINYYFLNPVNPEVRDFVSGIYKELLQKYDVDGLHLDYIRYPDSGDFSNDFGYDPYTRDLFKQQHGVDPIEIYPGNELWDEWVDFRKNTINEFVYRISNEAKEWKPDIRISAAVWPNYVDGPAALLQEPRDWVAKNYIDQLFPMSYNPDVSLVANDAKNSVDLTGGKALVVIGVATFNDLRKDTLLGQIKASIDEGVSGSAIFEYESLFEQGYDKALAAGLYRKQAIVPDQDPVLSLTTIISEMQRKIYEIYLPMGGMTDSSKYIGDLTHIEKALKENKSTANRAHEIRDKISKLTEMLDSDATVNTEVKKRMKQDLNYFGTILSVFLSKSTEDKEHTVH